MPEYLLYVFACLFVLTGEALIGFALYNRNSVAAVAGVALNGLAWPAYYATRAIREVNMVLRMLEVPLAKVKTADEAASMLTETFGTLFRNRRLKSSTGTARIQQ